MLLWAKWFNHIWAIGVDDRSEGRSIEQALFDCEVDSCFTPSGGFRKTNNVAGEGRHIRFIYEDGYEYCERFEVDEIFDFIIDDASHKLEDQLKALRWLPKIKPGGRLIIEDIQDIDKAIPAFQATGVAFNVIDLRHIKGRYDDVIIEIIKQ